MYQKKEKNRKEKKMVYKKIGHDSGGINTEVDPHNKAGA